MVDVKINDKWYGRLEVYGVGQPKTFEGTIQRIVVEMVAQLQTSNVQRGPNGREILMILRDEPMVREKEGIDMVSHAAMAEMLEGAIVEGTPEYDEWLASLPGNPWVNDSMWPRYEYLSARQIHYESSPEEYQQLWDYFEAKWPDHWRTLKKRSM